MSNTHYANSIMASTLSLDAPTPATIRYAIYVVMFALMTHDMVLSDSPLTALQARCPAAAASECSVPVTQLIEFALYKLVYFAVGGLLTSKVLDVKKIYEGKKFALLVMTLFAAMISLHTMQDFFLMPSVDIPKIAISDSTAQMTDQYFHFVTFVIFALFVGYKLGKK